MLNLQSSVFARVAAINIVGTSSFSSAGNGAVITVSYPPDAPINLARGQATTKTTIVLTW